MVSNQARTQLVQALRRLENFPPEAGLPSAQKNESEIRKAYYKVTTGSLHWVFPAGTQAEALAEPDLAPLPGAPEVLLGLCNLRGDLIPVYQLHSLLGTRPPDAFTALVLGGGEDRVGLAVDRLPIRLLIAESDALAANTEGLPSGLGEMAFREFHQNEQAHYQLDVDALNAKLLRLARQNTGHNHRHSTPSRSHSVPGATP